MPEQWRVLSQVLGDQRVYIAGRQLDPTVPMHGGNVEYSGGYSEDREEVVQRVAELNARGDA